MRGVGRERRTVYDAVVFWHGPGVKIVDDVPEDEGVVREHVAIDLDVVASGVAAGECGVFELFET